MPTRKKKSGPPPRIDRPRIPFAALFRMFVLGAVAVVAAAYGVWRYYFVPRPSMLVPVPSATEIEVEPEPAPSN